MRFFCAIFIFCVVFCTFEHYKVFCKPSNHRVTAIDNKIGELNVLIKVKAPFVFFNPKLNDFDGIDIRILKTISKHFRLDITFTVIENATTMKQLYPNKYDVITGDLTLFSHNSLQFTPSVPYMQDEFVWCVSRSSKIPHWRKVFSLMKNSETRILALLATIGSIYSGYTTTCLDTKSLNIWSCFFFAFTSILGLSYPYQPTTTKVRLLFALCLLIGLWCTTIVTAFGTMMFSNSIHLKQISTIVEIIDGDLHLAGDSNILEHLRNQTLIPENQLTSFEVCSEHNIEACLERLPFDLNLAVATSHRQLKSLPIQKEIFCFDRSQSIHTYLRRFFIHSSYPMKTEFNAVLKRLVEAGLITRQKEFEFQPETQRKEQEINSVNVDALIGLFVLCWCFLFLALAVACLESFIHKKAHCANPKGIYKWTSMMIDNERHFFFFHPENGFTWSNNRTDNYSN